MRTILHADLDAFYASVEVLDDPSLRGKPVIVGGDPDARGVVSAASYEARAFGVHSAMPLRTAHRLCPQWRLPARPIRSLSRAQPPGHAHLRELHAAGGADQPGRGVHGRDRPAWPPSATARPSPAPLKDRVLDEAGLVVSVGVATNKLCAKVASDLRKPDALVVVPPGGEAAFLAPLAVTRCGASGRRRARRSPTTASPPSANWRPCRRARCVAASESTASSCVCARWGRSVEGQLRTGAEVDRP